MYGHHTLLLLLLLLLFPTFSVLVCKRRINRVRLPILLVVPVRAWEFGLARRVRPSRPASACSLHTQAESGAYLRDSSRFQRRRPFMHLNRHTPSGQSRVYRVTQLRTDGVHCLESDGTGPVNPKVVPNGCYFLEGHRGPLNMRLSFPHPPLVWSGHVESTGVTVYTYVCTVWSHI